MKVAVGFKCHSGWAASVVVGFDAGRFHLIDRRRVDLIEPQDSPWAKAPYHAAEDLPPEEQQALVERARASAQRGSERAVRASSAALHAAGHHLLVGAVLTGAPMPDWTTQQILAVHVRMHKAEGAMFPAALIRAAGTCGLAVIAIRENELAAQAKETFTAATHVLIERLGKGAGPPWGIDQKNAALAAMIALQRAASG